MEKINWTTVVISVVVALIVFWLFSLFSGPSLSPARPDTGLYPPGSGGGNETHLECMGDACVLIAGPGRDSCSNSRDCVAGNKTHLECIGLSCLQVAGKGQNECADSGDCHAVNETHLDCVSEACVIVMGGGPDMCTSGADCNMTGNRTR